MIQLQEVNQWYKNFQVLQNVNFQIEKGEACVIVGRNGAGKSTLFQTILGFLPGYTGVVKILNQDIKETRNWMKKTSFLPEKFILYPQLSVYENLAFFRDLLLDPVDNIEEVLELTGMDKHKDKKAKDLSKGMLQRLGLCVAFLGDPELIILDEPTSGIDPYGRVEIIDIIDSLNQKGKTIIFSSHHLSEIERVGTHVILIENHTAIKMTAKHYLSGFYEQSGMKMM